MSGTTPSRAAKDAFISGCARRGITAAQVVMGSVPEADEVWHETAQAAIAAEPERAALTAERGELDAERKEWRGKAVAQRALLGEILDTPEVKIYAPRGSYAEWRQRAELEDS